MSKKKDPERPLTVLEFGANPPRNWREHTPEPEDVGDDYPESGTPADRAFAEASFGSNLDDDPDPENNNRG